MSLRSRSPAARLLAVPLAMLLGSAATAQPAASTPMTVRTDGDPVEALGRYLRVLAAFPDNLDALSGAGRSALAIGDVNAAISFFSRAEKIAPRDGRIKAGLASALVQMEQPQRALGLFDQAVALGVPEAEIASDRGLARDLTGDTRRAQQDYQLALRARPDDETTRRLAVSQAIAGDKVAANTTLDPLLRRQDRAAWRVRAFVQALTGDQAGAEQTALATMPRPQAQAMTPFFGRLATLRPGEKAAAVNLGQLPSGTSSAGNRELFAAAEVAARPAPQPLPVRRADAPLVPAGTPFGSGVRSGTQSMAPIPSRTYAAAPLAVGANETQTGTSTLTRTGTQTGTTTGTRTSTVTLTRTETVPVAPPPRETFAAATVPVPRSPAAPDLAADRLPTPAAPVPVASAVPSSPYQRPPAGLAPSVASSSPAPAQATTLTATDAAVPVAPVQTPPAIRPVDLPASEAGREPQPVAEPRPAAVAPAPPAVEAPAPAPAIRSAAAEPVRAVPRPEPAQPRTATRASAGEKLALADEAPGARRGRTASKAADEEPRGRGARDEDRSRRAGKDDSSEGKGADAKGTGKAKDGKSAAKDAKDRDAKDKDNAKGKVGTRTAARDRDDAKDKDDAKAKGGAKGKAGTKAAAKDEDEGTSKSKAKSASKDDAKTKSAAKESDVGSGGDRYWVQVASGANKSDLGKAWDRTKAKAPKLLGSRAPWTTPWKASNRVMVGPFKSDDEAQEFVNQLGKAGMGGMQITTRRGAKVERLPTD